MMLKTFKKYVSRPRFVSHKVFSKNVVIHEIKPLLTLDKPVNVGFSILDLSKLLMYEFYYQYIGVKPGSSAKLLFTDSDSQVYGIKRDDVYDDFFEDKNLFDFGDYPKNSLFYDPTNKKVIGKMKDEVRGKIINEFLGLKSKMFLWLGKIMKKLRKKKESIKMLLKT